MQHHPMAQQARDLEAKLTFKAIDEGLGLAKADKPVPTRSQRLDVHPGLKHTMGTGAEADRSGISFQMPGGHQRSFSSKPSLGNAAWAARTAARTDREPVLRSGPVPKSRPMTIHPEVHNATPKAMNTRPAVLGEGDKPVGVVNRITAMAFDVAFVTVLYLALVAAALSLNGYNPVAVVFYQPEVLGLLGLFYLVLFVGYFLVSEGVWNQSIGKRLFGMRIAHMSFLRLFVRTLGFFVSLVPAGLGLLWTFIDDRHRTWHDVMSGTELRRMER